MNAVFVDSSYYIALLNGDDELHETAIQVTAAHSRQSVTTAWVLTEVADAFSRPAFRRLAVDFIRELQHDTRITVVPPTAELFERALDLFSQRPDKHWSLTEWHLNFRNSFWHKLISTKAASLAMEVV